MAARRIHIKGPYRQEEANAAAASSVYPGMLVLRDSNGDVNVHNTEGGYAERAVAAEDALQGDVVSTVYTAENILTFLLLVPGSEFYGLLASGENVSDGDKVVSGGDGTFVAESNVSSGTTVRQIMAIVLEDKDLSGSGASDTLTKMRMM